MSPLLIVPLALWQAPLDMPEILLLAEARSQRLMAVASENAARQYRAIRSLPFYDERRTP